MGELVLAAVRGLAESLNLLQLLAAQIINMFVECQRESFLGNAKMESRIIKLNCTLSRTGVESAVAVSRIELFQRVLRRDSLLSLSGPRCTAGPANGATLQSMKESLPQWPSLFGKFVLPSGPKHLLLNLWITDSQATTPIGMLPTAGLDWLCNSSRIQPRREIEGSVCHPLKPKPGTVFQLKVSCLCGKVSVCAGDICAGPSMNCDIRNGGLFIGSFYADERSAILQQL